MKRRGTLCALIALGVAGLPLAAYAQPGYVVGRNLIFDTRYADGDPTRYPVLLDELLALKPDVLVGANTAIALLMKSRTTTMPIVLATSVGPLTGC